MKFHQALFRLVTLGLSLMLFTHYAWGDFPMQDPDVKGDVKTRTKYEIEGQDTLLVFKETYDSLHNLIRYENYEDYYCIDFKYDSHNNMIERSSHTTFWDYHKDVEYKDFNRLFDSTTHKMTFAYRYDKKGHIIEECCFGDYLRYKKEYEYDRKGNGTKCIDYSDINIIVKTIKYDRKGRIIKRESLLTSDIEEWEESKGKLINRFFWGKVVNRLFSKDNCDWDTVESNTFHYNRENQLTEHIITGHYSSNKYTFSYDQNKNQIERNIFDGKDSLLSKETLKYDDRNNRIEECQYDGLGIQESKESFKYDDRNNLIEKCYYNGETLGSKEHFIYDAQNNLLKGCYYMGDGTLKETFIYDNKRNLIQRNEDTFYLIEYFK